MSVCVEGLIRNDFYDIDNIEAVEAELNRASKCLNDYFRLEGEDKFLPYGLDCEYYQVYSEAHHITPPLFVRQGFYDVAKALGKNEAWYCDEFHLDNCGDVNWNYDMQSFEEWLVFINSTYGVIREFPIEEISSSEETRFPAEPVYYDGFKDLK